MLCQHCPLQSSQCPLEVETDEEIRGIMELAQVTLLASISLFSVPVIKYMNIYKEYLASCFESDSPRLGSPRGLTSSEGLMAQDTSLGRSHAEEHMMRQEARL